MVRLPNLVYVLCICAAAAAGGITLPDRDQAAPPPPVLKRASFRLGLDDLTGPDWPARFRNYSLFVCSPRFEERHLQQVRRDIPGAKLIAYFDTQFAMIDKGCASSGGTGYYKAFNRYFKPEWAITDLGTGLPVCLQSKRGWAGTQPAGWVAFPAAVDAVAKYHKEVTFNASWDGMYLDDAGSTYNRRFASLVEDASGGNFDIDGDGQADSLATMLAQWQAFRPYLFLKLREIVGPQGLLLANSGLPHAPDPSLNGITLESETCNSGSGSGGTQVRAVFCYIGLLHDNPRGAQVTCHDRTLRVVCTCRWRSSGATTVPAHGVRRGRIARPRTASRQCKGRQPSLSTSQNSLSIGLRNRSWYLLPSSAQTLLHSRPASQAACCLRVWIPRTRIGASRLAQPLFA